MHCEEFLAEILKEYTKTGNKEWYKMKLMNIDKYCDDYEEYINRLRKKYGLAPYFKDN